MRVRSRAMKRILPALLLAGAVLACPAHAATTTCKSADLRYPFQEGGPKTFGVFHLRATGTSCSTAHAVAAAWKRKFEVKYELPKTVNGYTFTSLKPTGENSLKRTGCVKVDRRPVSSSRMMSSSFENVRSGNVSTCPASVLDVASRSNGIVSRPSNRRSSLVMDRLRTPDSSWLTVT